MEESCRDTEELVRREQSQFLAERNHAGEVIDFHALRVSCGGWRRLAGWDFKQIQELVRHASITRR